ncbi:TPC1 [Symbiodinium sp. CCMP2456]|nr:TPC1 [Symbiodinium sp. CCMP2456]
MDIDEAPISNDLWGFGEVGDRGSGAVERDEFVQPLSRWVHESKTATRFIKYNVARALHENEELREHTNSKFEQLNTNINRIAVCLGVPLAESRSMTVKRSSTKTLQTLSAGSNKPDKDPSPSLRRSPTQDAVGSQALGSAIPTLTKQKSIVHRLAAMEEQQKTFFKSLMGSSGEDLALPQAQGASQSHSQSVTMSSPTSSLSIPGFAASQDARGKPGRPEGPPPSSDGDEVPAAQDLANKKEKAEGIASLQLEDPDEVDAVESRLDFSGFKDFYNKRRHSLQDSAHMSPDSSSEDFDGMDTEVLHSRSSVREMDSVLRGTMEVVEDLLQSAASAAVTRAEYTLRLRLGTLMSEMGGGAGRDRAYSHHSTFAARGTPKGEEAMSPALLVGSLGPEERHRWPAMRHLEAVVEADECPAPPPNQRARSLGEPPPERGPSRKRSSTVHVDVVESYPVQI